MIERVHQVWSTDSTYIKMDKGWAYLTAIICWRSRVIVSWRLPNTCDAAFCLKALREALENFGTPTVFTTDQGSAFTAPDFIENLEAGIESFKESYESVK